VLCESWSYPETLAITETHAYILEEGIINPVNVILRALPSNFSWAPSSVTGAETALKSDLDWRFDAIAAWSSDRSGVNYFNLSLASLSLSFDSQLGPPFTVTGALNHFDSTILDDVQFKMSSCDGGDEVWWGGRWHDVSSSGIGRGL
jgi:hypothetical protein